MALICERTVVDPVPVRRDFVLFLEASAIVNVVCFRPLSLNISQPLMDICYHDVKTLNVGIAPVLRVEIR
jgi:hypothetical protein